MARKGPRPSPLKKHIISLISGDGSRPMNKSELARALDLKGKDRTKLREALREMERDGEVFYGKKGRFSTSKAPTRDRKNAGENRRDPKGSSGLASGLIGMIRLNPAGHGWFMPSQSAEENQDKGIDLTQGPRFYVSAKALGTSLDGDTVFAKLVKPGGRRPQNREPELRARVEKIIERRSGRVTGTIHQKGKLTWLETEDTRVPDGILITDRGEAKRGQIVVVEIEEWNNANERPRAKVVEVLGFPGDPGVDVEQIIASHGVARGFPEEVRHEALAVSENVGPAELKRRDDWRKKDVITIDPATAKDYDDAVWVEKIENGWRLAVHIADVSHYVKPGSALDAEARERGNSTYLVDRVIPMLPETLSNGVCSLNPGVDRLTKCVVMEFGPGGAMRNARFLDAVIRTPRKFTYEEAQDILERKNDGGKLGDLIREAWELASVLRKRRFARGGIEMEMPEVTLMLNKHGVPSGFKKDEYNESHQLIEEFMLAANEAVARKVKNSNRSTIYRVHDDPDPDRLNEYAELARSHGYEPGDLTNRKHIQILINQAKGTLEEHAIKLGLLKSMKRAVYMATPEGHYGLAKTDYSHFTSPIRRYADLIMHRALQPLLENPPKKLDRTPNQEGCIEIAQHISGTERTSASAESESRRMKMLEWLELGMDYKEPPVFDAVVTEIRAMGLFIECTDMMQRGVVKREGFPLGHWAYQANSGRFINRKGGEFTSGSRLKVKVMEVDRVNQRVNFEVVGIVGTTTGKKKQQKKKQKR